MSRTKAVPALDASASEPRYSFFCYDGRQPLMEVLSGPSEEVRREKAVALIQTIEEVLGRACIRGAEHGDDVAIDTSTAYLLRFAADAAGALVDSLQVKE